MSTTHRDRAPSLLRRYLWLGIVSASLGWALHPGCTPSGSSGGPGNGQPGDGTNGGSERDAAVTDPDGDGGSRPDGGSAGADSGLLGSDGGVAGIDAMMAPDMACVPSPGADVPDDLFTDSNCDGIDGDKDAALFVAPNGDDASEGTIDFPTRTIGRALELAAAGGKTSVYISKGTYNETLRLVSGVSLYGGFDRTRGWKRALNNVTKIMGGPTAVTAQNLSAETRLEVLEIQAASGTAAGQSSYALFIVNSSGPVVVRRTVLTAGDGASGVSSTAATAAAGGSGGTGQAVLVNNKGPTMGGNGGGSACGQLGGAGGKGSDMDGQAGLAATGGGTGGAGGVKTTNCVLGAGLPGSNGLPGANGTDGANGAAAPGFRAGTASGFTPSVGGSSTKGTDGTGGGGGGAGGGDTGNLFCNPDAGGGGGGGGGGGCGGSVALGGGGGGGSCGLYAYASKVGVQLSSLSSGNGGAGGKGGNGVAGGAGGAGGGGGAAANDGGAGGNGGAGGKGGASGGAGGGGGGSSIALYGVISTISTTDVQLAAGTPGSGGMGGTSPLGMALAGPAGLVALSRMD